MSSNPFRELPSVSELVANLTTRDHELSIASLTVFAQQFLEQVRGEIESGTRSSRSLIIERSHVLLDSIQHSRLEPIINGTGVLIHTNLGRAPVSTATAAAMSEVAANFVSLELDPVTNARGGRMSEISTLMRLLTGAEATLVVNNNAAAVLLVLSALASGREVIVSRGEAVEIGGGFRIPDVMNQSGARLIEVGATNRTYVKDYESAISANTAAFLKVHASNFTIAGFTANVSIEELAELSARTGIPVIEDLGSGALVDTSQHGLSKEPTIQERIAAGANLITASGDKLLGGPQAGIIAGERNLIELIAKHPLARAVRADKTCLAGLAVTLRHYIRGDEFEQIPVLRMISTTLDDLQVRARLIVQSIEGVEIVETLSAIGGGSLPGQSLPSIAIALSPVGEDVDSLARRLRMGRPGIFGRIERGRVLADLRSMLPEDDARLVGALNRVLSA